jgi:predicted amidophosphoribosyltransferase
VGGDRIRGRKVKVCVKLAYICEIDSENSWKPGNCRKCKAAFKEINDKSIVGYFCEGCGKESEKSGTCPNCKKDKKRFVKRCLKSGTFPHIPPK